MEWGFERLCFCFSGTGCSKKSQLCLNKFIKHLEDFSSVQFYFLKEQTDTYGGESVFLLHRKGTCNDLSPNSPAVSVCKGNCTGATGLSHAPKE